MSQKYTNISDEEMSSIAKKGGASYGSNAPTATANASAAASVPIRASGDDEPAGSLGVYGADPSLKDQMHAVFFSNKLNVLFAAIPLAFFCHYAHLGGASVVFALSFLGLVPLATLLGDLTEDLALRTNDGIGALINVTFGNATELIISLSALRQGQYAIITNSLVGSILGNMLLVLGSSLIAAGWNRPLTRYSAQAAQIYMSSLMLSCFAFLIPTCFYTLNKGSDNPSFVLQLSQELSVALIAIYGCYIYFQVKSHKDIFDGPVKVEDTLVLSAMANIGRKRGMSTNSQSSFTPKPVEEKKKGDEDSEDEEEVPQFTMVFAVVATGVVAVIISFLSDLLVDTMTPAADSLKLGFHFISLVIVPIVGNVAEHASAILMAKKGKVDIAFGVALGSSIQIAMFAMPVMVIVSFFMGKSLDLNLTPFVAGCLFASVMVTYTIVSAGSSTYLSGLKLIVAYIILGLAFLRAPDE